MAPNLTSPDTAAGTATATMKTNHHPNPNPNLNLHTTTAARSSSNSLPPTAMPLISPHTLLYTNLAQSPPSRCSGRDPSQCRPISINTSSLGHADGSTLIKIGRTAAVCGVRAEILAIDQMADFRGGRGEDGEGEEGEEGEEEDENDEIIRTHNLLVPNIELSTGCSPLHLPGSPPSQEAQSLSQRLLSLLHTSRLVRLSDLCIYDEQEEEHEQEQEQEQESESESERENKQSSKNKPTSLAQKLPKGTQKRRKNKLKAFYTLYIDTVILSHDGNIFDASALAIYSALRDTLLPRARWDAELGRVMCEPERAHATRLRLRGCPVPLSFVVFRSGTVEHGTTADAGAGVVETVLCDPDAFEEGCCRESGCVTVDMLEKGEEEEEEEEEGDGGGGGVVVLKMEKSGGGWLGRDGLGELVRIAAQRWHLWHHILLPGTAAGGDGDGDGEKGQSGKT